MDLITKLKQAISRMENPLFHESLDYIETILAENKKLKEDLQSVSPENFKVPYISKLSPLNEGEVLPTQILVSPYYGSLGFATYQKLYDYVEAETNNYYCYSNSSNSMSYSINLLNKIELGNKFLFIVDLPNLINISIEKIIEDQKALLKKYKEMCNSIGKKFIIFIVATMEAPTYRYDLKDYCDFLTSEISVLKNEIFIYSGAQHQYNDGVKWAVCYAGAIHEKPFQGTAPTADPKYHFISLARIARPHRIYATVEILNRNLKEFGHCSLGSGYYHDPHENFDLHLVPEKHKHLMPLQIDGLIAHSNYYKQHQTLDERITQAFVNLVHETSYDNTISSSTWNVQFVTEKATKPFIWGQVPIYNMMAGSMKYIRELGFDMFDDIIDHSYDNEPDPMTRIKLVIDQLEKICQWSLDECIEFKQKNIDRFIKNREVAEYMLKFYVPQINLMNLKIALDSYDH